MLPLALLALVALVLALTAGAAGGSRWRWCRSGSR